MAKMLGDDENLAYDYDGYQSTITACAIAAEKKFVIVVLPTGCGKSVICGKIYNYYKSKGISPIAAVVPNEDLRR